MNNRTIGGLPLVYWIAALGAGVIGFVYFRQRSAAASSTSPATAGRTGTPTFTQQQEVQDFQIFSSLTGAQQASDLNFLGQVAQLFAGGSSTAQTPTTTPPTTTPPPPPPTPPAPPAQPSAPPATAPSQPGYGTVSTAQGQMVWLGVNQAGAPVYNVGGGAPVYFGNASALATGSQYEKPGYDIYTPVSYENLVAQSPQNLGAAYT